MLSWAIFNQPHTPPALSRPHSPLICHPYVPFSLLVGLVLGVFKACVPDPWLLPTATAELGWRSITTAQINFGSWSPHVSGHEIAARLQRFHFRLGVTKFPSPSSTSGRSCHGLWDQTEEPRPLGVLQPPLPGIILMWIKGYLETPGCATPDARSTSPALFILLDVLHY